LPQLISLVVVVAILAPGLVALAAEGNPHCMGSSRLPPREPREGSVDNRYWGTVTEVTKNSITIQWTATPGEKAKQFEVSETLAAGKVPKEPRPIPGSRHKYNVMPDCMYRLTDVRVGDWVGICYARINGVDVCDHICIDRRPDGLVPPLPKEAEDLLDNREMVRASFKGQPIPPEVERVINDWKHIPYHERMNARWARVAPMPREKRLPGPLISP
jgi:hypothetical protein